MFCLIGLFSCACACVHRACVRLVQFVWFGWIFHLFFVYSFLPLTPESTDGGPGPRRVSGGRGDLIILDFPRNHSQRTEAVWGKKTRPLRCDRQGSADSQLSHPRVLNRANRRFWLCQVNTLFTILHSVSTI